MFNVSVIKQYNPYILTFMVSLVLSYLGVSTDNLINHDAVMFMDDAKAYLRNDLAGLFGSSSWPFYPFFVAVVHQVFWFQHIEQTAHLINALLIASACILFIRIYAEITSNKGSLWVAAALVLTLVGINKYRADIMKDFGYWCFYLASFLCLLRYYTRPNWQMAVGWQCFMGLAFLFRLEGLVIILLGPLVMFLKGGSIKHRLTQTGALYTIYFVGFISAIVVIYLVETANFNLPPTRLSSILNYINIDGYVSSYDRAIKKLGELYWYEGSKDKYYGFLAVIYAFTLLAYVSVRIIGCLSFPYFVVLCFGAFKKRIVLNEYNIIILYFVAFLFLFFVVYMIKGPVLSSRYTTSLVFMLLLLLGQVVERLLPDIYGAKHKRMILAAVIVYLFLRTLDSVISTQGDSKTYILQAGYWIKENVAPSVPVYSNYYKAHYYTDRGHSSRDSMEFEYLINEVESNTFGAEAYVIVKIEQNQSEAYTKKLNRLIADGKIEFQAEFKNDDNDKAVIYRLVAP